MNNVKLELYYFETCPYCVKVLNYLKERGISVPLKDATQPQIAQELIRIGGKRQVPCLTIDGRALYESDDIIRWFRDNWRDGEKTVTDSPKGKHDG